MTLFKPFFVIVTCITTAIMFHTSFAVANVAPETEDVMAYGEPGYAISIDLSASDADGDPVTYLLELAPTRGTLSSPSDGAWVYTPNDVLPQTDTFTFRVSDGVLLSHTAIVTVINRDGGEAPVVTDRTIYIGVYPETIKILLTATDKESDSDALTVSLSSSPAHGTLTKSIGRLEQYTYTPDVGFYGNDSLTYTASDGFNSSETGVVTLIVTRPPIPQPAAITVNAFSSAALTLSATDPDGDALTYSFLNGPLHGSITGTAPNFTYEPDPGFAGVDTFLYDVADTYYHRTAEINVTVTAAGEPEVTNSLTCAGRPTREGSIPGKTAAARIFTAGLFVIIIVARRRKRRLNPRYNT